MSLISYFADIAHKSIKTEVDVMPIDICSIGLPVILRKSFGDIIFIYSVTVRISTENDMNFNAVMKLYMWSIFLWSAGPSEGFQIKLGQMWWAEYCCVLFKEL